MNNNEKKVKYFLRKTAYGLASMSAAFAVCSGIVHADTSSGISDSIPHKKQVNLGAVTLKNLISKYRGNDKAIAILLSRVDDFNRASQDTLPQLINSTEAEINNTLPQGRIIKQSIPVVRLKVERLGSGAIKAESINNIKAESINKIQGKSTNTIKAESINKIKVESINTIKAESINKIQAKPINTIKAESINTIKAESIHKIKPQSIKSTSATHVKVSDQELAKQSRRSQDIIKSLGFLSSDQKDILVKSISSSKDSQLILKFVTQATQLNNAESTKAKHMAQNDVASIKNISLEVLEEYKEKIQRASTKSQVDELVAEAKKVVNSNKETLVNQANGKKQEIAKLENLSNDEMLRYNTAIDNIVKQYNEGKLNITDAMNALNSIKQAAQEVAQKNLQKQYAKKIERISLKGLALSKKAKEIYEKHKSILPTPGYYADSVGTYLNRFRDKRTFGNRSVWTGQSGLDEAKKMLDEVKKLLKELQDLTRGTKEDKKPDVKPEAKPEAKPNIQVPKQAPTEAAKPALSPEALTRLTTWYNQAKDLLKDDQVKDKYVDILAVQKAVDQAYDHVEEGKFITTDQANQLANKLRDALQSLELKDKKVAKPEAKPDVKPDVKPEAKPEAKPNIQVPKQAPTEAAKPALSPEALTRLTTWYNQAKDLLKDDQVKDKYVDILAVQKAVDQAYDHVEEGKFITTDQANQLANKLRDALQSLELKDKKVAKPEAKPDVKPDVKPEAKPEAKPNIQVPKQAPTEAAKPALSPEALTRLTTWYNQAKDLLKDD
ncbi:YSIRK-type signal peptide-containing protein, partial [Streptococcus agalactiae]|uniref:YSIRK-type signal peptide-containing protein n=2 Tax=Streptococcus agalactiae TaxID=1311 RepID=UPI0030EF8F32